MFETGVLFVENFKKFQSVIDIIDNGRTKSAYQKVHCLMWSLEMCTLLYLFFKNIRRKIDFLQLFKISHPKI